MALSCQQVFFLQHVIQYRAAMADSDPKIIDKEETGSYTRRPEDGPVQPPVPDFMIRSALVEDVDKFLSDSERLEWGRDNEKKPPKNAV